MNFHRQALTATRPTGACPRHYTTLHSLILRGTKISLQIATLEASESRNVCRIRSVHSINTRQTNIPWLSTGDSAEITKLMTPTNRLASLQSINHSPSTYKPIILLEPSNYKLGSDVNATCLKLVTSLTIFTRHVANADSLYQRLIIAKLYICFVDKILCTVNTKKLNPAIVLSRIPIKPEIWKCSILLLSIHCLFSVIQSHGYQISLRNSTS
jgi:hypothetical protein